MVSMTAQGMHEGKEIFELLLSEYPDFGEKNIKAALRAGDVMLNGREARGDEEIKPGDVIDIFATEDEAGLPLKPRVVYQDENFVILDKPAGLLSVSDNGEKSAADMAEEIMRERGEFSLEALMVPYLVYPLEKYVSGLIIFAKHEDAYVFLAEAMTQRRVKRYYICPVIGKAKESAELLAYHLTGKSARKVSILQNYRKVARPIVTRYEKLAEGERLSLLRVRTLTNYLHQIRAHLAFEGLPVLGDDQYGDRHFNKKLGARHISLWLKTVIFETGKSNVYAYINGKKFESDNESFPRCVYDEGLLKLE